MTDSERWEACGKPDIICHDDGSGENCFYTGPDEGPRVCEICNIGEPSEETDVCPECEVAVWWVPKCPECGNGCTWTYGEIKPMEYEAIKKKKGAQP